MKILALILLQLLQVVHYSLGECRLQSAENKIITERWWWREDSIPKQDYQQCQICVDVSGVVYLHGESKCLLVSSSNMIRLNLIVGATRALQGVNLDNNNISSLKSSLFVIMPALQELSIRQNDITTLPDHLFTTLNPNLTIVDLSYNAINTVGKNTFTDSIKYLNLMHNKLEKLDFHLPDSLIDLEISFNMISYISETSFQKTVNLTTLNLNNNLLATLSPLLFISNKHLLDLYLSHNVILVLSEEIFAPLVEMQVLILSNNALRSLNFTLPATLMHIDFTFNSLLFIDAKSFSGATQLLRIHLNNNLLNALPVGLFDQIKGLIFVDLKFNNITLLAKDVFAFNDKLKYLYLSANKMRTLDFYLPHSLSHFDLSNNSLSHIEVNSFYGLNSLVELKLNNNYLRKFPIGCFSSLNKLTFLNLSHNNIIMTYGTFGGLTNLTTLDIAHNSITDLPELVLGDMKNLTSLNISYNSLTELDVTNITKHLTHLRSIRLEGNRFKCSYLTELIAQFKSSGVEIEAAEQFFENNVRGIGCIHENQEFTSTERDAKENQSTTTNNELQMKQFIKEALAEFGIKFLANENEQILQKYVLVKNIQNIQQNHNFSSVNLSFLSEKIDEMDGKMEGLSKNYISIFQTVILLAIFIIILLMAFKKYVKSRLHNRRVISFTEMSSLHMEQ